MLDTKRYVRKPFYIDAAVRVTAENLQEIADWCKGDVRVDKKSGQYVKVRVQYPRDDRQTRAFVGDWVLKAGKGFKVYTNKAFVNSFDLAEDTGDEIVVVTEQEPEKKTA